MAYDFVRWGIAGGIFIILMIVLGIKMKQKVKAGLVASFAAIIIFAILLLVPVENFVYGFPTVEKIYNYRYHEKLLTYAECDEGAFCVGQKDENNFVYYTFDRDEKGYKLPNFEQDDTVKRSSKFGVYMLKRFDNQMIIVTQAENSAYDGVDFKPCSSGYYSYTVVYGEFNYSRLTCGGERVELV